jgi:hypothetical protein
VKGCLWGQNFSEDDFAHTPRIRFHRYLLGYQTTSFLKDEVAPDCTSCSFGGSNRGDEFAVGIGKERIWKSFLNIQTTSSTRKALGNKLN